MTPSENGDRNEDARRKHRQAVADWKTANPDKVLESRRKSVKKYSKRNPDAVKQKRERLRDALVADATDKRHGTHYGYCLGCRCESCRSARTEYARVARQLNKENPEASGRMTPANSPAKQGVSE